MKMRFADLQKHFSDFISEMRRSNKKIIKLLQQHLQK